MAAAGRKNAPQLIHELSAQFGPAQVNALSIPFGTLPGSGAFLLIAHFLTSIAFDATTVTASIGSTVGGAQVLAAQNIKAAGRIDINIVINAAGVYLVDTPLYLNFALTGGPNTVGACTVWLEYVPQLG